MTWGRDKGESASAMDYGGRAISDDTAFLPNTPWASGFSCVSNPALEHFRLRKAFGRKAAWRPANSQELAEASRRSP
jgi:hypothetical protein